MGDNNHGTDRRISERFGSLIEPQVTHNSLTLQNPPHNPRQAAPKRPELLMHIAVPGDAGEVNCIPTCEAGNQAGEQGRLLCCRGGGIGAEDDNVGGRVVGFPGQDGADGDEEEDKFPDDEGCGEGTAGVGEGGGG